MNIANMKVGTRLSAGFGLVLLMMVVLNVIGLIRVGSIGEISAKADGVRVRTELASNVDVRFRDNAIRTLKLIVTTDAAQMAKINEGIDANKKSKCSACRRSGGGIRILAGSSQQPGTSGQYL